MKQTKHVIFAKFFSEIYFKNCTSVMFNITIKEHRKHSLDPKTWGKWVWLWWIPVILHLLAEFEYCPTLKHFLIVRKTLRRQISWAEGYNKCGNMWLLYHCIIVLLSNNVLNSTNRSSRLSFDYSLRLPGDLKFLFTYLRIIKIRIIGRKEVWILAVI